VESGEKISTTRTQKELNEKKEEVVEIVKKIKSGSFEATPGMHCNWCDYKDICPFAWKG
jgi:CRISPR/Cas system-associated exonuclease Cas4 (RecB family)